MTDWADDKTTEEILNELDAILPGKVDRQKLLLRGQHRVAGVHVTYGVHLLAEQAECLGAPAGKIGDIDARLLGRIDDLVQVVVEPRSEPDRVRTRGHGPLNHLTVPSKK